AFASPMGSLASLAGGPGSMTTGGSFGALDYVYCKGAMDAWCNRPDDPKQVLPCQRGMFDYNLSNGAQQIGDGLSNTFAMGEGAQGSKWTLKTAIGAGPFAGSYPNQAWEVGEINAVTFYTVSKLRFASQFGCTLEKLNTNPVTQTIAVDAALQVEKNANACR